MNNPLSTLMKQMGLSEKSLIARLGMDKDLVMSALSSEPPEPLLTYLKAASSMGVKNRIVASKPLSLWFTYASLDRHFRNVAWRKQVKIENVPMNKSQLVGLTRFLRKRRSYSCGRIREYMMRNWIPTVEGSREWYENTVRAYLSSGKVSRWSNEVGYRPCFAEAFRAFVLEESLIRLFDFDGLAMVRYEITMTFNHEAQCAYVLSGAPMPDFVRSWAISNLENHQFFTSNDWGLSVDGEKEEGSASGVHGLVPRTAPNPEDPS